MKGGAKPYLNLPADITDAASLKQKMDFIYVSCHGAQDNTMFLVPDNTYIMFRGPAGVSIPLAKTEDELLNKVKYLPDRSGNNESNAAKIDAKKDRWWTSTYADITSKNFLKEILYKTDEPDAPSRTSIYEPGDLIQNIKLQFHNDRPYFFLVGVYELPMRRCLRDDMAVLNKEYFEREQHIVTPILKKFLEDNRFVELAALLENPDLQQEEFDSLFKLVIGKKSGIALTDYQRLNFLELYSEAIRQDRTLFMLEQYNISNCPGRANNKLAQLGIGPIPCNPIRGSDGKSLFSDACGSGAAASAASASAGPLGALLAKGPASAASEYTTIREISLHKLVTEKLQGGGAVGGAGAGAGPFQKKYKFILIEACRALPETYGELIEYEKYGIPPPSVGFNEAASLELEAKTAAVPSEKATSYYRSRRYSLNVREPSGGVCFTTLLKLSRDRLRFLPPSPVKAKLLSGQTITNDELDSVTRYIRMVDSAIRALPINKQFNPLQPVSISSVNGSAPRQGVVIAATGKLATNTPAKPVKYAVRSLTNAGVVQQEEVEPARLVRKNALEGGPNVVAKLTSGNLPFSGPETLLAPTTVDLIDIPSTYGKFFRTERKFESLISKLQTLVDELPFKPGDEAYLKFDPNVDPKRQIPAVGGKFFIKNYVEPIISTNDPSKVTLKIFVEREKPKPDGSRLETMISAQLLAKTKDAALASIPKGVAGGGRGKSRSFLSGKLCRCIKKVRKTVKVRKGSKGGKESAAIGICVRSVLGTRGRTLRRFRCSNKAYVETQDPLKKKDKK